MNSPRDLQFSAYICGKFSSMDWIYYIIIILIIAIIIISVAPHFKKKSSQNLDDQMVSMENVGTASYKLLAPLRIQACERLLLYVERIQFPVLIKRIYIQGVSRNDFQFSLLQNVEDELEHNLAQRLYVSENSWHLIILAKEEVLQNVKKSSVFQKNIVKSLPGGEEPLPRTSALQPQHRA